MRQLQKRLEETEAQMSRILQAMQSVTEKVGEQGTPRGSASQEKSPENQIPKVTPPAADKTLRKEPEDTADTVSLQHSGVGFMLIFKFCKIPKRR